MKQAGSIESSAQPFSFNTNFDRLVLFDQAEGKAAQDGEVVGCTAGANSATIFSEDDI